MCDTSGPFSGFCAQSAPAQKAAIVKVMTVGKRMTMANLKVMTPSVPTPPA